MFDLKRPCVSCPFRKGQGENFMLPVSRLVEILAAPAFQCHRTVDYDHFDDPDLKQGDRPQQCAGLMKLLHDAGRHNQIMQVSMRFGVLDPETLDPRHEVYESVPEMLRAHRPHRSRLRS